MNNQTLAELIVSRIQGRKKPASVFITPIGIRLKSPSQLHNKDVFKDEYLGTYTREITVEQVLDDLSET